VDNKQLIDLTNVPFRVGQAAVTARLNGVFRGQGTGRRLYCLSSAKYLVT